MNFANFWPIKSRHASLTPLKQGAQYGVVLPADLRTAQGINRICAMVVDMRPAAGVAVSHEDFFVL